jgi:hypothetical protein
MKRENMIDETLGGRKSPGLLELGFDAKIDELTKTNKRLKRKIFDLYTIFEISRHLNTVLNIDDLLDAIILTIIGQMGINGAAIFVRSQTGNDRYSLARHRGITLDGDSELSISHEGPLIAHISTEQNRAYDFAELKRDLDDCCEVDILASLECELLIPMSLKNEICGLLLVTSKISQTSFFEDDKDFLLIVNNPLGIIKNYLELLGIESAQDNNAGEYVGIVHEEVDRIARIVRQLLDLHRPDSGEMRDTDLKQLLEETLLLTNKQLAESGIHVVREYCADSPLVVASAEQMRQVFLNLIMNANYFMPNGGTITVSIETEGRDLVIRFGDSGEGIPEEDLPNIFEPFFTSRREGAGTGLGLAICDNIVRKHKGSIVAANSQAGGSQFTIRIPLGEAGVADD